MTLIRLGNGAGQCERLLGSLNFSILRVEKLAASPRSFRPLPAGLRKFAVLAAISEIFSFSNVLF